MKVLLACVAALGVVGCLDFQPEEKQEAQCTGAEVFVVDAWEAPFVGGPQCPDGWFYYTDHIAGPPDPDGGQWISEELGDLRCHQQCETDADCAEGCGACRTLGLFNGGDYSCNRVVKLCTHDREEQCVGR